MNATVARIVEILFQDTEMTEEVQALKDEVMDNCQERYEDMVARGIPEDDAIAAVVDSLKGMEEVVNQYPRRVSIPEAETDEDGEKHYTFSPDGLRTLAVSVLCEDVTYEPSSDGKIHITYNEEDTPFIQVGVDGDTLRVSRDTAQGASEKARTRVQINAHNGQTTIEVDGKKMKWDNFSDVMSNVQQLMKVKFTSVSGEIVIALPEECALDILHRTTSGDMELSDVYPRTLRVESTSGDVTVEVPDRELPDLRVKGSSGDVEVRGNVRELTLQTMSGDASVSGVCPSVAVQTISGDIEISGELVKVCTKSVSGDINVSPDEDTITEVDSKSTSGDLTIVMPDALKAYTRVNARTVSGDIHNRLGCNSGMEKVTVNAQTISGDVTVK